MCEFISGYEDSKLLKKRMYNMAEKEEEQELETIVAQPLVASK
jgi:hypothetical protein